MKKKLFTLLFGLSLLALVVSACSPTGQMPGAANADGSKGSLTPTVETGPAATSTTAATAVPKPTAAPKPTATPVTFEAEQVVNAYAEAIQKQDYTAAADMLSQFSLIVARLTPTQAAARLAEPAAQISGLKVVESKLLDEKTVLVHVQFAPAGGDPRDENWPVRNENGTWKINYNNVVDFHTLIFTPQTLSGVTLQPFKMVRFSDRIELHLLAQNTTNDPLILGQRNHILATFHFKDQNVDAEPNQIVLQRRSTNQDMVITVKGTFTSYPTSVDIVKIIGVQVPPWYTFQFAQ